MIDLKDKKLDDGMLDEVYGGRFINPVINKGILFGKKNDDDKNANNSETNPGQRLTTPDNIMRA